MYKFFLPAIVAVPAVMLVSACKKNNSQSVPAEVQLIISTDALANNSVTSSSTDFNLTVESAMPSAGVKITVLVTGEIDNQVYYTSPLIETKSKITKVNINNLPKQKICICTITVTSKSTSTNFATTSFRVVFK